MYIGEIIKDYRLKNKLSQRTFASRTSLSPSYINTLEKVFNPKNGKPYSVTTSVALELSQAMSITIEELLSKLNEDQEFTLNEKQKETKYYMCPVYGRISAGQPNWAEECIEGRLPGYSTGATMNDIIEILLRYKAYNAANLDGGASSTMSVEGKLWNRPSAGAEYGGRTVSNAWIVTNTQGKAAQAPTK